jgi:hypothetical protein
VFIQVGRAEICTAGVSAFAENILHSSSKALQAKTNKELNLLHIPALKIAKLKLFTNSLKII